MGVKWPPGGAVVASRREAKVKGRVARQKKGEWPGGATRKGHVRCVVLELCHYHRRGTGLPSSPFAPPMLLSDADRRRTVHKLPGPPVFMGRVTLGVRKSGRTAADGRKGPARFVRSSRANWRRRRPTAPVPLPPWLLNCNRGPVPGRTGGGPRRRCRRWPWGGGFPGNCGQ